MALAKLIAALCCVTATVSAYAECDEIPVTPDDRQINGYTFVVSSTNATKRGEFHVQITTTNKIQLSWYSHGSINFIERKGDASRYSITIGDTQPKVPVLWTANKTGWSADFTLPPQLRNDPNVFFIFTVEERPDMPSATFYEFKLLDFLVANRKPAKPPKATP